MNQVRVVSAFWSASTGSYVTLERRVYSVQGWKNIVQKPCEFFMGIYKNCNFDF